MAWGWLLGSGFLYVWCGVQLCVLAWGMVPVTHSLLCLSDPSFRCAFVHIETHSPFWNHRTRSRRAVTGPPVVTAAPVGTSPTWLGRRWTETDWISRVALPCLVAGRSPRAGAGVVVGGAVATCSTVHNARQ